MTVDRRRRSTRHVALGGVVVALLVGVLVGSGAGATAKVRTEAITDDPIESSVKLSVKQFPREASADAVVVVRSDNGVDGLTAAGLAAALNGPVLTTEKNALPKDIRDEIGRVSKSEGRIVIIGGSAAIEPSVEAELASMGSVERVAGADRFATSAATAKLMADEIARRSGRAPTTALLANGVTMVDSFGAGALAAQAGYPVLLTNGDGLAAPVEDTIEQLELQRVTVVGGPNAIPPELEQYLASLGVAVDRLNGGGRYRDDRYGTAAVLADTAMQNGASASQVVVGKGSGSDPATFTNTILASAYAGATGSAFLLTGSMPESTRIWLEDNADAIGTILGVGDVSSETLNEAADVVENAGSSSSTTWPSSSTTWPSSSSTTAGAQRAPGAVGGVSASQSGPHAATVQWSPPSDPGNPPFNRYRFQWSDIGGGGFNDIDAEVSASSTNVSIGLCGNFSAGQYLFSYSIAAVNSVGQGPAGSGTVTVNVSQAVNEPCNVAAPRGGVAFVSASAG